MLDKYLKKLKHELVDFPDKYKHLYPNKFNPQDWDLKVCMGEAFKLLEHGIDP